jgi:hypothetical protein
MLKDEVDGHMTFPSLAGGQKGEDKNQDQKFGQLEGTQYWLVEKIPPYDIHRGQQHHREEGDRPQIGQIVAEPFHFLVYAFDTHTYGYLAWRHPLRQLGGKS